MAAAPWSLITGGVNLVVRLTPRGGREAIDSIETLSDGRAVLKVRVRAVPSKGEANAALKHEQEKLAVVEYGRAMQVAQ